VKKLSIRDLNLHGKRAFVRVDFNVPIEQGTITDDTRIRAALPTIEFALGHGATVILASHLGRPKGKPAPECSLKPVAARLRDLLRRPVLFAEDCIGAPAEQAVEQATSGVPSAAPALGCPGGVPSTAPGSPPRQPRWGGPPVLGCPSGCPGGVVLLENLRFHPEEEKNDSAFAAALAALADVYVNDAFGAAHRAHASIEAITKHVRQAAAGLLMERELEYLGRALESPERPFVAILGGAKVSDKLEVIENLLTRVDRLLIGGAMAYTFLKSRGVPVGRSRVEDDKLAVARDISQRASEKRVMLVLPADHVVADKVDASASAAVLAVGDEAIGERMGLDIGPATVDRYGKLLQDARTVVWNGPMGVFEIAQFAKGTAGIARAVAAVRGTTIVGGGDSISAVTQAGVADRMTHISTGGGASLEFLAGRTLPGVEALTDK
jgi:phosphoglycerate kinase